MTATPPLRDRIAEAARTVRIRPGHNSTAIIRAGGTVALSGNEADDIAAAVMAVVQPELDRLRTERDHYQFMFRHARDRADNLATQVAGLQTDLNARDTTS